MKIGFFDSGLGGLIILKAVAKELPHYDYEFYGDTAHLPYGDRSEEEIFALTKAGVQHLFDRDCALVIIACNTASAETLRRLQDSILVGGYANRRILGVIIPTIEAVFLSGLNKVTLFATKRTVSSGKYERELTLRNSPVALTSVALPQLVPLIENGDRVAADSLIVEATLSAIESGTEAIILGCTHYCLLKEVVRKALGERGVVFSQDELIPERLRDYLARHPETETVLTKKSSRNIFLTAHKPEYDAIIKNLLNGVMVSN